MSLQLFLQDHPHRAIAVATKSHALIFHHSSSSTFLGSARSNLLKSSAPRCMVEFSALDAVDLTRFRMIPTSGLYGTLGLININTDIYLCVITGAVRVATVRPGETVQRIQSVDFRRSFIT